jgi:hypothetical protein
MGLVEAGAIHWYWAAQTVQRLADAAWNRTSPNADREDARKIAEHPRLTNSTTDHPLPGLAHSAARRHPVHQVKDGRLPLE